MDLVFLFSSYSSKTHYSSNFPKKRIGVHPETASFDPGLCSRFSAILGIVALCLRLQKTLGPCPEAKSTIFGWTRIRITFFKNVPCGRIRMPNLLYRDTLI